MRCRARTGPGAEVGYEAIPGLPEEEVAGCRNHRGCRFSHSPCLPASAPSDDDPPCSAPWVMGRVMWLIGAAVVAALGGGFLFIRLKGGM